MSVARRFAAAFAVVGLGVLAYAVPASATESDSSGGACITNPTPDQFVATMEPHHGIARVRAADGVNLCADVLLSAYTVPATWVGQDFNETAIPQTIFGKSAVGHVQGTSRIELSVAVPQCGGVQIDLYTPPEITAVNSLAGHSGQLIKGFIWRWWVNGKPLLCGGGTPTPTPTDSSTAPTPTPSESTVPATPTPTETSTAPTPTPSESTGPATPTPTESSPAPESTSPAAVIPPTGGTPGPVAEVPTVPAADTTPVLASTGSNATIPLIGIGTALLGLGVLLSLLGRRRTTA